MLSRARILVFRATDELGDPELKKSGSRRQNTEDPFSFVLDICFATTVAPRRTFFGRLDFSFLVSDVRSLGLADATA